MTSQRFISLNNILETNVIINALQLLLEKSKSLIYAVDNNGNTPLFIAAEHNNNFKIFELLISKKSDVTSVNNEVKFKHTFRNCSKCLKSFFKGENHSSHLSKQNDVSFCHVPKGNHPTKNFIKKKI